MIFRGEYFFLSNLFSCPVTVEFKDGIITFRNAEAAFQAHKCLTAEGKREFERMEGLKAKKYGRKVELRPDWNSVRVLAMKRVIDAKFDQNKELARKLIAITEPIVETNTWNDRFWGVCNGRGENMLGKLLTKKREKLLET